MCRLGLTPGGFWASTPFELAERIRGYGELEEARVAHVRLGAWLTAALTRTRRMPRLESFMKRAQTPEEQERIVEKAARDWEELERDFVPGLSFNRKAS